MLTAITCTGDRPICFDLLRKWVASQTVHPDQWIVVDDGAIPVETEGNFEYIRRAPRKSDPEFTVILNLQEAFVHLRGDKILFLEDDEYYAAGYIGEMSARLDRYDIVGIGRSKYYHLPTSRWYRFSNMGYASLAHTGFNRIFFSEAKRCLEGSPFFDIRLWEKVNGRNASRITLPGKTKSYISKGKKGLIFDDAEKNLYVGMKGMPGRKGIGIGHGDEIRYCPDTENILRKWIPDDDAYGEYIRLKGGD